MMLYTSYRLLGEAGASHECNGYTPLADAIGKPTQYGFGRPISIETLLKTGGISVALWALRAVHPEQRVVATRLARVVAISAFDTGHDRFPESNAYLQKSTQLAIAYLSGDLKQESLDAMRREVWHRSERIKLPYKHLYYSAWLALARYPERLAPEALRTMRLAHPSAMSEKDKREIPFESRLALEVVLRRFLFSEREDVGPGDSEPATEEKAVNRIVNRRLWRSATK